MKVKVAPGALDALSEEEQKEFSEQLQEMFKDFDPENPPGTRVMPIAPGLKNCPTCGGELRLPKDFTVVEGEPVNFVECTQCDQPYMQKVTG